MKRSLHPTEHQEQTALFKMAELYHGKYPELRTMFAIPNHWQGGIGRGRYLRAEGQRGGVPDIFLPVARNGWHGCFIELKRPGGKVSASQMEWQEALTNQGYLARICWSAEEAIRTIEAYLRMGNGRPNS